MTVNVATHLRQLAETEPFRTAVICPHGRDNQGRVSYTLFNYRQLYDDSSRIALGLEAIGVQRGMRTVLMVTPSLDFFAVTFALFQLGAVPVLIDPGMGIRHLGRCLAEAEPTAFIGIPKAHRARVLLGWARSSLQIRVTLGRRAWLADYTLQQVRNLGMQTHRPAPQADTAAEEMAAILFTSGSTGIAKGAVYTHGIFAAQVEMLRQTYDIRPGEIDLATFPLFALFAPALGMTAIVPDMDPTRPAQVDPTKILQAIEQFGVTNLFGSPALIHRVGRYGAPRGVRLPSLKRVISAGAPVPAAVIERFAKMLPQGVEVFTPYGATEALPVASIGSAEILGETRWATEQGKGVCVGCPVAGVEVRIIGISEQPIAQWSDALALPVGQIGEIVVRGPIVTRSYWKRESATQLAKIADPQTGGVWHRMGDVGYLDAQGRLWFCGRKSQRVETPQGTLFTIPCEAIFNTHPDVFRSALVGVSTASGTVPVMCIELESPGRNRRWRDIEAELQSLAQQHEHTRSIRHFLRHPAFPVDIRHNAKIFREQLAVWAKKRVRL